MRIRSTKPEFYRSKTISELSWANRHVLKALESYVDDNGVGKDDVALFAADAFPRDMFRRAPETFRSLSQALDLFSELGLIVRYEDSGDRLLYIDRWAERQRIDKPSKGRFRRPDGTLEFSEPVDRASYRSSPEGFGSPPESFAPGTGEQGNRGTGEQTLSITADAATENTGCDSDFADFWEHYPRKVGKGQARKAWKAATKKAEVDELIRAAEDFAAANAGTEARFIPHPATWLNGERWADEEPAAADGGIRYNPDGSVDESSLPPVESTWMRRTT